VSCGHVNFGDEDFLSLSALARRRLEIRLGGDPYEERGAFLTKLVFVIVCNVRILHDDRLHLTL
jgi:hypothetical protein